MIYFENQYITIEYEPENKLAHTIWHQFAPSEEYRAALNKYLDLVKEHKVIRWIGDTTNAKVIRPQDQEWTTNEWLPKFMGSGVKRMAVIVSLDIFNRMAVDNILKDGAAQVPFSTKFFPDEKAARDWVMEVS